MRNLQSNIYLGGLLIVLGLLIHTHTLQSEVRFDDHVFSYRHVQEHFNSLGDYFVKRDANHYYPVYYLSNILLFRHFGQSPVLLHAIAIAIFIAASLSLYWLLLGIVRDKWIAFLTCALFMAHPMWLINVQMVAQNFVFINIFFNALSLRFFLEAFTAPRPRPGYYALSFLFFLIGLLAFEISGLLFVYVFLLSYFVLGMSAGRSLKVSLPFMFLTVCFAFLFLQNSSDFPAGKAIGALDLSAGSLAAGFYYLQHWFITNLLFPTSYVFMKSVDPISAHAPALLGAMLLGLIGTALLVLVWRRSLKSLALLWFMAGFPFSFLGMFAHYHMGLVMEPHWLMFPSAGFFLLLVLIARDLDGGSRLRFGTTMLIILLSFFLWQSQQQQLIAKTEKGYAHYWNDKSPDNFLALMSLAMTYLKENDHGQAIHFAQKAYRACKYDPYTANLTLGNFYLDLRDQTTAMSYLRRAIEADPQHPAAYLSFAVALKRIGQLDAAATYVNQGRALKGSSHKGLGPN